MSDKTTTKQRYHFSYNLHHWGCINVEAHSYYEACEEAYNKLHLAWKYVDDKSPDGSEVYLCTPEDFCPIPHPADWPNSQATCVEEIHEEPSEDDFIPASDKGLEVEG